MAVNILDRYLSLRPVPVDRLSLVALGCFYVAAKFEETYYPTIDQMLRFVPNAGKKEDVLRMERSILGTLNYKLGAPTAVVFLKRYVKAIFANSMMGMIARFMCEHCLMSYSLSTNYLPSMVAAAVVANTLRILGRNPWTATLEKYTGYKYEELRKCMIEMRDHIKGAPDMKCLTIYKKYCDQRYLKAALIAVQKI